jgi:hypothetical protein
MSGCISRWQPNFVLVIFVMVCSIINSNCIVLDELCSHSDDEFIFTDFKVGGDDVGINNKELALFPSSTLIGQVNVLLMSNRQINFKLVNSENIVLFSSDDCLDIDEFFVERDGVNVRGCAGKCAMDKAISVKKNSLSTRANLLDFVFFL